MSNKNLVIIDSDSVCYIGSKDDTLQQVIEKVDYKVQEILYETKADYYVLLLSKGRYFRHDISKSKDAPTGSYKANRTYGAQPWVKTIKEYLISQYKAVWYPNLEADDICAWLMGKNLCFGKLHYVESGNADIKGIFDESTLLTSIEEVNKILVAKDKDLLYSIPSKGIGHLNFSKKFGKDDWGMEWVNTSESDANSFVKSQMIIGDASDGIPGLYRKGKAYWSKISSETIPSWGEILQLYIVDYGESKGIYEFQKNYRLLHMLKTDEDMLREVGYIPELPEFQENTAINTTKNEIEF